MQALTGGYCLPHAVMRTESDVGGGLAQGKEFNVLLRSGNPGGPLGDGTTGLRRPQLQPG